MGGCWGASPSEHVPWRSLHSPLPGVGPSAAAGHPAGGTVHAHTLGGRVGGEADVTVGKFLSKEPGQSEKKTFSLSRWDIQEGSPLSSHIYSIIESSF